MKKVLLLAFIVIASVKVHAQMADTTMPFYKRFPTITPFQILLSDSTTMYKKADLPSNTPVVFMIFSPDCNHCQEEASEIVKRKEELKNIHFVMITMHPFTAMKDFIKTYELDNISNVVVGRDIYYLMPTWYKFHHLPFHALYNKEGKLLSVFEGSMNVGSLKTILEE
ncbi:MAG: TlpA family protein disulfide reductase [Flavisolibacter sp.]